MGAQQARTWWRGLPARYRRPRSVIIIGLALAVLASGVALAQSGTGERERANTEALLAQGALAGPPAQVPSAPPTTPPDTGVRPAVTTLALGAADAPAAGVTVMAGIPTGTPLADGVETTRRGLKPRTLSVVRASTAAFRAVGVSWQRPPRMGEVSVAVRAHRPGGDWGPWRAVGPAEDDRDEPARPRTDADRPDAGRPNADRPNADRPSPGRTDDRSAGADPIADASATEAARRIRGGADLIWVGTSDGIQLAVTILNGQSPQDIRADLIDPLDAPGDTAAATSAAAGAAGGATGASETEARAVPGAYRVSMPPIVRRPAWGAAERQMNWRPAYATSVKAVAWHHTATTNDYTPEDVPKILRSIYHFQTGSRGWGDIGYNVLVDRFGRLWEGRSGGLSRPVVGAQAGGFNTGTAGVAIIGDYRNTPVPAPSAEAAAQYVAWKLSLGPAVDPRGNANLTGGGGSSRYPAGTALSLPRVFPHRHTNPTECPGARGVEALPTLRDRAAELLGDLTKPETVRTKLATWRPGDAQVRALGAAEPLFTGARGDMPLAADFDGDGTADIGTFTPSTATWTISSSAGGVNQTVQFGIAGDRPVPADYDGDGDAELAVWRPAEGVWYIRDGATIPWGVAGDVPVPADYNGDGATDPAVWRPSTGMWYMRGIGEFSLGESWHIPVPADYNGDGAADPASWSPVSYRFFIRGQGPVKLGERGDIPVPAQYDGDGRADPAVFHAGGGKASGKSRGNPGAARVGPEAGANSAAADPAGYEIHRIGRYDIGAPGDIPVPLR